MNVQATPKTGRIPTAAVTGLIVDAMQKSGVPAADAAKIAELMLEADLVGADAHGVFRLPQYVQRLKLGSTNARPNIKVTRTRAGDRAGRRRQRHGPSGASRGRRKRRSSSRARTASPGSAAACRAMRVRPASMRRCRSRPT